jgi:hypothetical protein
MINPKIAFVVFLDGCVVEKDTFFFSSRLDVMRDGDYHHGRLSAFRYGEWFYQDREQQVVSVCVKRETASEPGRASCGLERMSGKVGLYWKGEQSSRDERLSGSEDHCGPMSQLAQIDGVLYACGVGGNVFKRQSNGWVKFNEGLNTKTIIEYQNEGHSLSDAMSMQINKQSHIESIGGIDGHLYAVGLFGLLYHRKESIWQAMESPTNASLFRVKCLDKETVYIAGEKGILLRGNAKGFKVIQTGVKDDLMCLEWLNGKLYVGGYKGIYVLEGEKLHRVDTKQKGDYECVAMDAYDGQLLAVSERWFLVFDGKDWKRINDPDNEEILKQQP